MNVIWARSHDPHILGAEQTVNRSTSESAEYVFAKMVISPRLRRRAAKINQFLLPQFPNSKGLWGKFEDPTPEDKATNSKKLGTCSCRDSPPATRAGLWLI